MGQGSGVEGQGPAAEGQGYRGLRAWQRADDLAVSIVLLGRKLRTPDPWSITQLKTAAASVPANIAEGYSRLSLREYLHHLSMARGSLGETEYWLHLLQRLGDIEPEHVKDISPLVNEAGNLLYGLIRSLARRLESQGGRQKQTYLIREPEVPYGATDYDDLDPSDLNP